VFVQGIYIPGDPKADSWGDGKSIGAKKKRGDVNGQEKSGIKVGKKQGALEESFPLDLFLPDFFSPRFLICPYVSEDGISTDSNPCSFI